MTLGATGKRKNKNHERADSSGSAGLLGLTLLGPCGDCAEAEPQLCSFKGGGSSVEV